MTTPDTQQKAHAWKATGIAAAIAAALLAAFSMFSFHKAQVYQDQAVEMQRAADGADAAVVKAKHGSLPTADLEQYASASTEHGGWDVEVVRDGKVIAHEEPPNFLADEGENDLIACFYRNASCPTSFTWALLNTTATPAENSTWSSLSSTELVVGTSAGYEAASKTLTRDSTGWATLDTVASGTGGCTESSCARVSTAQQTITASGNWSVGARYIVIRVTTSNRLIAVAQLSADRTLQSGDQLNLTYRQAMQ